MTFYLAFQCYLGVEILFVIPCYNLSIWWLDRVTLLVAFGFMSQILGRWWEPMNGTLSLYE